MAAPVDLQAPGFRFNPDDRELVGYYLERKVRGHRIDPDIIPVVDMNKHEPWDLPDKSFMPSSGRREWYLFAPREKKYPKAKGTRINRATPNGYWKSTGNDQHVLQHDGGATIGMKKMLVYHEGRAPHGVRTNWVIHEYRLHDDAIQVSSYAVCRLLYKKEKPICTQQTQQVGVLLPNSEMIIPSLPEVTAAVRADGDTAMVNVHDDWPPWTDEQLSIIFDDSSWTPTYLLSDDGGGSSAAPDDAVPRDG